MGYEKAVTHTEEDSRHGRWPRSRGRQQANAWYLYPALAKKNLLRKVDSKITQGVMMVDTPTECDSAYRTIKAGQNFFDDIKIVESRFSTDRIYVGDQVLMNLPALRTWLVQHMTKYVTQIPMARWITTFPLASVSDAYGQHCPLRSSSDYFLRGPGLGPQFVRVYDCGNNFRQPIPMDTACPSASHNARRSGHHLVAQLCRQGQRVCMPVGDIAFATRNG
jgi:hypothetical protein